jgi:signal peptidase II
MNAGQENASRMPIDSRPGQYSLETRRRGMIAFFCSALLIGLLDAASKLVVWSSLPQSGTRDLFGVLHLQLHQNSGFMLGIGSSLDPDYRVWVLSSITAIGLLGLLALLLYRGFTRLDLAVAWGAVVGSAAANLVERIRVGAVTDFLQLDLGWLHTGIFNLADLFNLAGLCYIASAILVRNRAL